MLLYHGSNLTVSEPRLVVQNRFLDFVSENRAGKYSGKVYDFIYGPVANDDVYTTFTLYTAGVLTKEQTIEALKIKKLYNQLVLTLAKALNYLKFYGTVSEEENEWNRKNLKPC